MDVFGLPLHPLVVHAVVVLVPLAALGALLVVFLPKLRPRYGWLTVAFAAAGAASAIVARFSGETFVDELGLRGAARVDLHMALGSWTPWPVLALAISLGVLMWADRRPDARGRAASRVAVALTVVFALTSLVMVVLTGEAGARAVWGR